MIRTKRGFTLIEVVIAVALGAMVTGALMYLYHHGNKMFYKTTEHAAFREESLMCLEHISRDLEQLMVSTEKKPTGKYYLEEPYEFVGPTYDITRYNPRTKQDERYARAAKGLRFMRYHSTVTTQVGGASRPQLVAKRIEYSVRPADPADPSKGLNLYRNTSPRPINKIPLADIAFIQEPNDVTRDQIGASPNAILSVMIIPNAFNRANGVAVTRELIETLKRQKGLVSRTFHLSGMETFYTLILNEAFRLQAKNATVDGVYKAVMDDARTNLSQAQYQRALNRFETGAATSEPNFKNYDVYKMEYANEFTDADMGKDPFFAALPIQEGVTPAEGSGLSGNSGNGPSEEGSAENQ